VHEHAQLLDVPLVVEANRDVFRRKKLRGLGRRHWATRPEGGPNSGTGWPSERALRPWVRREPPGGGRQAGSRRDAEWPASLVARQVVVAARVGQLRGGRAR